MVYSYILIIILSIRIGTIIHTVQSNEITIWIEFSKLIVYIQFCTLTRKMVLAEYFQGRTYTQPNTSILVKEIYSSIFLFLLLIRKKKESEIKIISNSYFVVKK